MIERRPPTLLERKLIEFAVSELSANDPSHDAALVARTAAQLQVLGAERAGLAAATVERSAAMLEQYEASAGAGASRAASSPRRRWFGRDR